MDLKKHAVEKTGDPIIDQMTWDLYVFFVTEAKRNFSQLYAEMADGQLSELVEKLLLTIENEVKFIRTQQRLEVLPF